MSTEDIAQSRGTERDHILALGAAAECIRQNRPDLELIWGATDCRSEQEMLDQLWRIPGSLPKYLAVTVLGGSRTAPMSSSYWIARAGLRTYLWDTILLLRKQGDASVAECIAQEMLEDRLTYWQMTVNLVDVESGAKPAADCVDIRAYDISDTTLAETCIDAVRREDCDAVDHLIQDFGPGVTQRLIDAYFTLETGLQKSRMVVLLRHVTDPAIHPVLQDFVCGPDMLSRTDDLGREAYADALCKLDGDRSRFISYYEDDEAIYAGVASWRQRSRSAD